MANGDINRFVEEYSSALLSYLDEGGERTLRRAYELGRRAIAHRLGSLDLAETHEQALLAALQSAPTSAESSRLVRLASDFFAESLSPFEMTHRGFLDALATMSRRSVELAALNKQLEREVAERRRAEAAVRQENTFVHLLQVSAIAANMAPNLEKALRISLEEICASTGWPMAHVAIGRRHSRKGPRQTDIWVLCEPGNPLALLKPSERTRLLRVIGLAARTLRMRRAVWISDIAGDPGIAEESREHLPIRSACGFPIRAGRRGVAVVELFSDKVVEPHPKLMTILNNIGAQLGRVIERKIAEDALRAIPQRILDAQEDERNRVALELHDDICQRLSALKIHAGLLEDDLPAGSRRARRGLKDLERQVVRMIEDVRQMAFHLHPTTLHELGLVRALQQLSQSFEKVQHLTIRFSAEGTQSLECSPPVTMAVYRIAQEALSNVAKHSGAKRATVTLSKRKRMLTLRVEDNGVGFTSGKNRYRTGAQQGLGLISMKERAGLIGGRFHITSSPGQGTTVQIDVPMVSRNGNEKNQNSHRG